MVSPEFPTGSGKVDIHLKCVDKQGIIEVKSFVDAHQVKSAREKAAWYAKSLGLDRVTLAIFLAVDDDTVLEALSGEEMIDDVQYPPAGGPALREGVGNPPDPKTPADGHRR